MYDETSFFTLMNAFLYQEEQRFNFADEYFSSKNLNMKYSSLFFLTDASITKDFFDYCISKKYIDITTEAFQEELAYELTPLYSDFDAYMFMCQKIFTPETLNSEILMKIEYFDIHYLKIHYDASAIYVCTMFHKFFLYDPLLDNSQIDRIFELFDSVGFDYNKIVPRSNNIYVPLNFLSKYPYVGECLTKRGFKGKIFYVDNN